MNVDEPVAALNEILDRYIGKPLTKQLATEYVREVIAWAKKYGIEV